MKEMIALYAINYIMDHTEDGRERVQSALSSEDIIMFANWADQYSLEGEAHLNAVLEIIVNKVNELKGI